MLAKIQKWGNSQGLRLTKSLLADARLDAGDEVEINIKDGAMIISPALVVSRELFNRSTGLAIV